MVELLPLKGVPIHREIVGFGASSEWIYEDLGKTIFKLRRIEFWLDFIRQKRTQEVTNVDSFCKTGRCIPIHFNAVDLKSSGCVKTFVMVTILFWLILASSKF